MSINQRIKILVDTFEKGVEKRFAEKIGVSRGLMATYMPSEDNPEKKLSKPGYDVLSKIIDTYPNISTDWLLSGEGPMVKGKEGEPTPTPTGAGNVNTNKNKLSVGGASEGSGEVLFLRRENERLEREVQEWKDRYTKDTEELKESNRKLLDKLLSK